MSRSASGPIERSFFQADFLTGYGDIFVENITSLLILLITANSTPVLMMLFFRSHFSTPLDINKSFLDGKPVFGHTKTFRGILSSLLFTSLMALAIGIPATLGAVVSIFAMLGDLLSSFIKRRFDIPTSRSAPLLDQLPESSLPLLVVKSHFDLIWEEVAIILIVFFIIDLILSYLLVKFYENAGS